MMLPTAKDKNITSAIWNLAFGALTLLDGCQEGHPARKNLTDEVLAWLSSEAKYKQLAYGSADAIATQNVCFSKIQNGLSFWY